MTSGYKQLAKFVPGMLLGTYPGHDFRTLRALDEQLPLAAMDYMNFSVFGVYFNLNL